MKRFEQVADKKGVPIPGMIRYIPSGVIYCRKKFSKLGIPPIFESTGEVSLGRAKVKTQVLIQKHLNKYLGIDDSKIYGRRSSMALKDVIEEVLRDDTPTLRATTQEKHRQFFSEIEEEFGGFDVNAITVPEFLLWVKRLRKKKSRKSFEDYSKHFNKLMRFAYERKYATHLITFPNPDGKKESIGRVYTMEEISALWDVMNDETRDQFVLCFESMMRLREALRLTWDRVCLKTGKITLRAVDVKTGSKTGRGREFVMSPHALERLRTRYSMSRPSSLYVFPSKGRKDRPTHYNKTAWTLAKKAAGIKGRARWHDLRHTAISRALLEARLSPLHVSEYAGVSLQTIQRVYLHSKAEQTQEVSKALNILKKGVKEV